MALAFGMAVETCKPCAAQLHLPSPLAEALRRQVATAWRAGEVERARALLAERAGAEHANRYLFHLPRWRGWCHRCREPMADAGENACPACGALNLAWPGEEDPPGPPLEGPEPVTDHPVELAVCPCCKGEISHGTTRCWQKRCGFTLPEGFVCVAPTEPETGE